VKTGVDRWAPWFAGLMLLGLGGSYAVTRISLQPRPSGAASKPHVPLDEQARVVAQAFVETAVARHDLAGAWWLVAPSLRAGVSEAEWRAGTLPVAAYPVSTARVGYRTKVSHADDALLEVTFWPRSGRGLPRQFLLGLRRQRAVWLVASWSPVATVAPHVQG
jgi:hypothetical protein